MSALEDQLVFELRAAGLESPTREYRFDPERRWRWDLAWPAHRLAVEIDGGTWSAGAHSRGTGQTRDAQKQNAGVLAGWRVLRITTDMIRSGEALTTIARALTR